MGCRSPLPILSLEEKAVLLMIPPRYLNPDKQRCAFAEINFEMTSEELKRRLESVPGVTSVELQTTKTEQKNIPGGTLEAAEIIKQRGSLILNTISTPFYEVHSGLPEGERGKRGSCQNIKKILQYPKHDLTILNSHRNSDSVYGFSLRPRRWPLSRAEYDGYICSLWT